MTLGDNSGSQISTNLTIGVGSSLDLQQVIVDKATVTIAAATSSTSGNRGTLTTECNLVLLNSSIQDNGLVLVKGNLDLSAGGANNTLCGSGGVAIKGCVFGGNGVTNKIISNCAGALVKPTVCSQQIATPGCPGPQAASSANEQACDALVTSTAACFFSVLPVELILFSAVANNRQGVALRWVTASEKNNASFVVERSADGVNFQAIRTLRGAGTVQGYTYYDVIDEQPIAGLSYYRLRQTDFDGAFSFSPVRTVKLARTDVKGLDVYPGATGQQWVVSSALPVEEMTSALVKVYDVTGRMLRVSAMPDAQAGRWTLDTHTLPSGVYIVQLITKTGTYSQRILLQAF
ncbi:MAG: hypothetical protein NVSMB30_20980 [Hymenobacter sp.]